MARQSDEPCHEISCSIPHTHDKEGAEDGGGLGVRGDLGGFHKSEGEARSFVA